MIEAEEQYQGQVEERDESPPAGASDPRASPTSAKPAEIVPKSARGRALIVAPPGGGARVVEAFLEDLGLAPLGDGRELPAAPAQFPEGTYVSGPLAFDPALHAALRAAAVPIVLLARDPRDAACRAAGALLETGDADRHDGEPDARPLDDALGRILDGDADLAPFDRRYDACRDWLEADGVLALRFEDVAGPRFGGQDTARIERLTALAAHVGWRGPLHRLAEALADSYGSGRGARAEGAVGMWQEALSPAARRHLLERTRALLGPWGYDPTEEPPPARGGPGTLGALLAALGREHVEAIRAERWAALDRLVEVETDSAARLQVILSQKARLDRRSVRIVEGLLRRYGRLRKRMSKGKVTGRSGTRG